MTLDEAIKELESSGKNTRFDRAVRLCTEFFGKPRIRGSHHVFKMKWAGEPCANIQNRKGFVSPYQVRQVIAALKRLQSIGG